MPNNKIGKPRWGLWQRLGFRLGLFIVLVLFVVFLLPKLFYFVLPFLLGLIFAWVVNPLVRGIMKRMKLKRRPAALFLVIIILIIAAALLFWLVYSLIADTIAIASNWSYWLGNVENTANYLTERLTDLPEGMRAAIVNVVDGAFNNIAVWAEGFTSGLLAKAGGAVSAASGLFISLFTFILAAYFFTADYTRLKAIASEKLSRDAKKWLKRLRDIFKRFVGGYMKQQALVSLASFAVMLFGFALIGQHYILLVALVIAVVDFIPIIGAGTVLIPWGVTLLIVGRTPKGIGILAIYAVVVGVRLLIRSRTERTEPGLTLLQLIISLYAGFKLNGFFGLIWMPIIVMIVIKLYKTGVFADTEADLRAAWHKMMELTRTQ